MSDKYGYIGIETLLNFCSNDKNHCVTPNDFMRMNRVKIDERPHGEWEKYGDKIEAYDIVGHKSWGQKRRCTNCGFIHTYIEDFGFYSVCPNCGASMSANDEQVTGKLKQPCPCDTCQTAIDRCGCQMHLCSQYQKWKEGDAE